MPISRLWKALGATQPLFSVEDGTGSGPHMDDSRIISIGIESGTTMAGLSTSGCTVEVNGYQGYLPADNGMPMTINLTPYGSRLLSDLTGKTPPSIWFRFTGRVVSHDVTDTGTNRKGQLKLKTTLTGQDWASFISQLEKGADAHRSEPNVWRVYRSLFNRAAAPGMYELTPWGQSWHWVRYTPDEETQQSKRITTGDVIQRYTADLGALIRQDRAGYPTAWSHDHIMALAESWEYSNPDPIQRAQVLSPVTWRRPSTIPKSIHWQQQGSIGDQGNPRNYAFSPKGSLVTRAVDIDMTHIWDIHWTQEDGSGLRDIMRARYYREKETDLVVEKVTIDLLQLIKRNHGTDRAVAGQMLTLNHGDPVVLGYDWPVSVDGVYFAQKVIHRIDRDSWTVELDLMPSLHVTGKTYDSGLWGRTWDTRFIRDREWDEVNLPPTWDQIET